MAKKAMLNTMTPKKKRSSMPQAGGHVLACNKREGYPEAVSFISRILCEAVARILATDLPSFTRCYFGVTGVRT